MRIIAGQLRGRRIEAPKGMSTRPTTDRVREALFSILGNAQDKRVADLFAGTGAMGMEALSRGAAHCLFVEASPRAAAVIRRNLNALDIRDRSQVFVRKVEMAGAALESRGPLDWVLADPPWPISVEVAPRLLRLCTKVTARGSRLLIGHRSGEDAELVLEKVESISEGAQFRLVEQRHWGDSGMTFLERL